MTKFEKRSGQTDTKKILFISGLDFKEKSIQVIRKTPEAYVAADWEVDYIVARDNSLFGDYHYEDEINPEGINITRVYWPFAKLRAKYSPRSKVFLAISADRQQVSAAQV